MRIQWSRATTKTTILDGNHRGGYRKAKKSRYNINQLTVSKLDLGSLGNELQDKAKSLINLKGTVKITNKASKKCLDVSGGSKSNGANIIQWDWHGGANQKFQLADVGDGYCKILIANTDSCVDVSGESMDNGATVHQWQYWGGDNQKWKLEPVDGNFYKITCKKSGKVLEVVDSNLAAGGNVVQWDYHGGDFQHWQITTEK